jgi:hypothetical protein
VTIVKLHLSHNTHYSGKDGVVRVHGFEWLFDTNTILDEDDSSVLADDGL